MEYPALIPAPAAGAQLSYRLYTDNTDKSAATRMGTGLLERTGAGIIRIIRTSEPKSAHPSPPGLQGRGASRST